MGFYRGPNIVTNGLVLNLDAANVKSYPGSGTTWRDLSGNNNTGSLVNGPVFNIEGGGSILFVSSSTQYVNVINSISNPTTLTVITFIKPNTITTPGVVWGYRDGTTQLIQLTIQDNTTAYFQVRGSGNTLLNVSQSINVNNNYMLAGVFNKNTGQHTLYVNNTSVTGTLDLTSQTLTSALQTIGSTNNGSYISPFNGNIYLVQVYNRALSASEILQNYNSIKSRFNL